MPQNYRRSVPFISTDKPNRWFFGYEKLGYYPNLRVKDSWKIIPNAYLEKQDQFIRQSSLNLLPYTPENATSPIRLRPCIPIYSTSFIKSLSGKDNYTPLFEFTSDKSDYTFLLKSLSGKGEDFLHSYNTNPSYIPCLMVNIMGNNGSNITNPSFNQGYVQQGNQPTNLGTYQNPEINPYPQNNMDEVMETYEESDGEGSDGEWSDGKMQQDQIVSETHPCIIVSQGFNGPRSRYVEFDSNKLKGDMKLKLVLELLIQVRTSFSSKQADEFTVDLLYSKYENGISPLFESICEAYWSFHPNTDINKMYVCTESFIQEVENLIPDQDVECIKILEVKNSRVKNHKVKLGEIIIQLHHILDQAFIAINL